MGDGGRELAEGGHASDVGELCLGFLQRLLRPLPIGDVLDHADTEHRLPTIVPYDVDREVAPDEGAVFPAVALLDVVVVALAVQEVAEEAPVRPCILRVGERGEGHATELVGAVTQYLLELPIAFEGPTGRVDERNPDRRLFEKR